MNKNIYNYIKIEKSYRSLFINSSDNIIFPILDIKQSNKDTFTPLISFKTNKPFILFNPPILFKNTIIQNYIL